MTALLSHTNTIPAATLSLSVGSSTNLANIKSPQVPVPFADITTTAGAFTLSAAFTATSVRVLALLLTDLQAGAQIRLNVYAAGTPLFGEHVPYVVDGNFYVVDGLVYSVLTAQTEYISELEPVGSRQTILVTLPETVTADEVRVFVDGAQASVRVASLWCAPAFELPLAVGWGFQTQDYSLTSRVGPNPWINRRRRNRVFSGTVERLLEADAIGPNGLEPLFRELGSSSPVLFLPRSTPEYQRLGIYGLLDPPGRVSHVRGPIYRAEIDINEIA
ncbi:MAG: hypothetical protein ACOC0Q_10945 [Wenzhouxiangella sp.]